MIEFLRHSRLALLSLLAWPLSACVTYLTPGAGAPMQTLQTVSDVARLHSPEAPLPARIAVVRLQAADYRSFGAEGIAAGNYSVVLTREVEASTDFDAMGQWPQVLGVEPLSRLLLPVSMQSFGDLRAAAASANTDILFAYTFDTQFRIENHGYRPEELITLGVLPGREASVSSTAAGVFVDVRSGYVYGTAEGSAVARSSMTKWTKPAAADETRLEAEKKAFAALMENAKHSWASIASRASQTAGSTVDPENAASFISPLSQAPDNGSETGANGVH